MEIQYTKHAEAILAERGITKDVVEELLSHPQQVIKGKGKEEIVQGVFERCGERFLLRVLYVKTSGTHKIITAYWTSKIDKYWEGKR